MVSRRKILVVDDQNSVLEDIKRANQPKLSRYEFLAVTNFKDAIEQIQDVNSEISVAILDISFSFDGIQGYEADYGWLLIPLLRKYQPQAAITIHSNTANQTQSLYRGLYIFRVENMISKSSSLLSYSIEKYKKSGGIPLPQVIENNLKRYVSNISARNRDEKDGLDPELTFILEFVRARELMPVSAASGAFVLKSDGKPLSKSKISSALRTIKTWMKCRGLLGENQSEEIGNLKAILEANNLLMKAPDSKIDEIYDILEGFHRRLPMKTLENQLQLSRQTIRTKIDAVYNRLQNRIEKQEGERTLTEEKAHHIMKEYSLNFHD